MNKDIHAQVVSEYCLYCGKVGYIMESGCYHDCAEYAKEYKDVKKQWEQETDNGNPETKEG